MAKRRGDEILRACDLFCGAGGTTSGAEMSQRVRVVLAVNCWPTAIASHKANHPNAMHVCKRIEHVDPRQDKTLPEFDLLMASPECQHHSIARGGRPVDDQRRATPWDVLNWVSVRSPRWLLVENVREFRDWGPLIQKRDKSRRLMYLPDGSPHMIADPKHKGDIFRAWIASLQSLGYQVDFQILNAADFGAATKRLRLFILARRGWTKRDIPWPEITHPKANWRAAWTCIDWSRPCPSIFTRKRPLVEKTLRRIEIGLKKFVGAAADPFLVHFRNHCDGKSVNEPLNTLTAGGGHHGLAVPFRFKMVGRNPGVSASLADPLPTIVAAAANHAIMVPYVLNYHGGTDPDRDGTERSCSVDEPIPVIPTENRYGLVAPFIVPHFGERPDQEPRTHGLDEPLPTITGHGAGSIAAPFFLAVNHGGDDDRSHDPRDPLATLTAKTGHSIVVPWLTKYNGTGGVQDTGEPVGTISTHDRFGLAMASLVETMRALEVVDIGFRMLDVDELARAQGFPDGYVLTGTKADQVRQVGNSVSPLVAKALCETIAEAV